MFISYKLRALGLGVLRCFLKQSLKGGVELRFRAFQGLALGIFSLHIRPPGFSVPQFTQVQFGSVTTIGEAFHKEGKGRNLLLFYCLFVLKKGE